MDSGFNTSIRILQSLPYKKQCILRNVIVVPHVTDIMPLLQALHPIWSAIAIKSTIMTSRYYGRWRRYKEDEDDDDEEPTEGTSGQDSGFDDDDDQDDPPSGIGTSSGGANTKSKTPLDSQQKPPPPTLGGGSQGQGKQAIDGGGSQEEIAAARQEFTTQLCNVFTIGQGSKALVTLSRGKDLSKPFEVHYDASGDYLGAVLLREGHAIAYEICRLHSDEQSLGIYEKELLAIMNALDTWKHYLLGTPFIIQTDHQSLKYFMMQTKIFDKQLRWEKFISQFHFHIAHIPSKHNQVANALPRRTPCNVVSVASHNDFTSMHGRIQVSLVGVGVEAVEGMLNGRKTFRIVRFWQVHGRDGQSSKLQRSLDYSGMHRVFDGEDFDDTMEELDGAEDYLSDRREEEEALVETSKRAEKRFVVSHGKAAKRSSKDKEKSRSKRKKRSDDLDSDTDTDSKTDTDSDSKTYIDSDSKMDFDAEIYEVALAKLSQGSKIWNSSNGVVVGIWTMESEAKKEESWGNGIGKKDQGVLISGGTHFQAIIALSADVTNARTNIFWVNFGWRARLEVKSHHYTYKGARVDGGYIQVWERRRTLSVMEKMGKRLSATIKGKQVVGMQEDALDSMTHTRSMKMAMEELFQSRQQEDPVEVESDEAESESYHGSGEIAVAAFDPNKEETQIWLKRIGLYEFACLPWDAWAENELAEQ
ncbi:hypothetical protein L7F22_055482 [Adiantum nelumboides]|nr:hypothetical protein [Adiantum nelumboides]